LHNSVPPAVPPDKQLIESVGFTLRVVLDEKKEVLNMAVVAIRKAKAAKVATKVVEANQKALDALPLNSGMWRVENVPGLYVRCRATSKSFWQQRRVDGVLVKEVLGPLTMKAAKEKALDRWSAIQPANEDGNVRLGDAVEAYIRQRRTMKEMAPATEKLARYNLTTYLKTWSNRTLEEIGHDRAGIAALHTRLTEKHGAATCNQVIRLLAAVYRWHRDRIQSDLPDWPRKVAEIHHIEARDWAYSDEELKAWWHAKVKLKDGKIAQKGVSTLGSIKRMWWLTALFTGARKGSIESLKWPDVELAKKVIHFRVTKGDRPYAIPISDVLADLLEAYQRRDDVPPSEWVFPSTVIDGAHVKDVKNPNEGVGPAHRLRHTFRTALAQLGASPDQARMLMGHSMGGDVSRGYITSSLVVESLRPLANAIAEHYRKIVPGIVE
jgi:integrase